MDGEPLVDRIDGTVMSIDPGVHTFPFETSGESTARKVFVIREGEKERRERIVFGPGAGVEAAPAPPGRSFSIAPPPPTAQPEEPTRARWSARRISALAVAGVGAGGLVVGTVFGLMAVSRHDEAKKACPAECTDRHGVDLWSSARSAGNISTAAFIVGAAGLAGCAILWFTEDPEPREGETQVGLGPSGLQFKGVW
jgi:hypothetical protein